MADPEMKEPKTLSPTTNQFQMEIFRQQMRDNQSLSLGFLAGLAAAAFGAAVWAIVTALTKFQIGWMAIGIGFLVGMAVRKAGKGIDLQFGLLGGGLALLGCLTGNLLAVVIIVANQEAIPFLTLFSRLNLTIVAELLKATFNPMDLLFYGLAIYQGYKISILPVTPPDLPGMLPHIS
jgi:hypothetical protein